MNMIQGPNHIDISYSNYFYHGDSSLDTYYSEVADSGELEPVEVVDFEVGMQVADIGQRQCMDKGSMAHEPYELKLEGRHLLSQHLP